MGRPKRTPESGTTAEQLVLAAEREFAARGFAGTRLEDIATRVGLTRPSLLHHFPTKESIYHAVVEQLVERLRASLVLGMTSRGTFSERLAATVGRYVDHLFENPAPAQLLMRELQDAKGPGEELIREQVVPLLELVESFILQTGRDLIRHDLNIRAAILDLVGAVTFYAIAGPSRQALWGTSGHTERDRKRLREHFIGLAQFLFLRHMPVLQPVPEGSP
jgi:AcrR family transcriptional regulator